MDTTLLIPNDQVLTTFVDAVNKIAYVGTFYGKMYIYNLSNLPASVNQLSVYTGFDHILGIQVFDNIAYLAEASVGLDIVNVINPITPGWIKSFHTSDIACDVKVSGHYVYLADALNGIMIIDVTDPFNPEFVSSMKTSGATYVGLSYNSSFLYSADANYGVETFNVATPTSPLEIGNYITSDIAQRVFYQNGYIYVAASSQGLLILQYQP